MRNLPSLRQYTAASGGRQLICGRVMPAESAPLDRRVLCLRIAPLRSLISAVQHHRTAYRCLSLLLAPSCCLSCMCETTVAWNFSPLQTVGRRCGADVIEVGVTHPYSTSEYFDKFDW